MSKPMPSPHGTNLEGLTMPGPVAAYDAALEDDQMQKVSTFLADKLTHEDHAAVLKMLGGEDDDDSDATMAGDAKRYYDTVRENYRRGILNSREYETALMSPPRRPVLASDAAGFAAMFPNAGRLSK